LDKEKLAEIYMAWVFSEQFSASRPGSGASRNKLLKEGYWKDF
jgi:hypothetical protein